MAPKQKPEPKKGKPEAKKAKPEAKKAKPEPKKKAEQKPEQKQKKEEKKPEKGKSPKPEAKKAAKPQGKAAKPVGKATQKPEAKQSKDKKEAGKTAGKKPTHGLGVFIKDLDFPGLDHASVTETFKQFKTSITEIRVRHRRYVMIFLKSADAVNKFLELDGKTVQGCKIQVQAIKRAQPTRPREDYCKTVYVSGLPGKTTKKHLMDHFKNIGKIIKIRIYNKPKVHAFIYFQKNKHALRALKRAKKPYLHGRNHKQMGVPRSHTFRLKAKLSIRTIHLDRIKWVKRYYRAPPSVIRARERKTLDRQKRRIARLRAAKVSEEVLRKKYPTLGKKSLKLRLPWWAAPNPHDRVNHWPYWRIKKVAKEGEVEKPKPAKASKPKPKKAPKTKPEKAPKAAKPQPKAAKPQPKGAKPAPKAAKPAPKAAKPAPKAAKPQPKAAKPEQKGKPQPKETQAKVAKPKPQAKPAKPQPKAQPKGEAAKPAAKKAQPKPQPKAKK
eukprot:RCo018205